MPALEMLYLDNSQISDESFSEFAANCSSSNPKLSAVFLENCAITDASKAALLQLVQHPSMSKLRLTGTKISRAVFEELFAAAPELSFSYGIGGGAEE
ncbi:hypothetical protein [Fuerstiella marisgermanici]|nr:hypothetical protein [Fuerstiella marisgermanici]